MKNKTILRHDVIDNKYILSILEVVLKENKIKFYSMLNLCEEN